MRLWPYVKPHGRYVVLSLITLVLMAGANLCRPLLMGDIIASRDLARRGALMPRRPRPRERPPRRRAVDERSRRCT